MQTGTYRLFFILILAALVGVCAGVVEAKRPYEEADRERRFFRLLRPAKSTPEAQLAHAERLREQGRRRGARRQFRALVRYWPSAPEAPKAQLAHAEMLAERGKLIRAFEQYEVLFDKYPGQFPHADILARQFDIAYRLMTERKGRFLFFPGFKAPERAIPYFESIVRHGPRWEKSAEAQFHIGQAYETTDQYELAVHAYATLESRYPRSPWSEKAAYGRARCLYLLARESPNHINLIEDAIISAAMFRQAYPQSEHIGAVSEYLETLQKRRAEIAYGKARYYDRIAREPRAALTLYELFVERFPQSDHVDDANRRIAYLREKVESSP